MTVVVRNKVVERLVEQYEEGNFVVNLRGESIAYFPGYPVTANPVEVAAAQQIIREKEMPHARAS